MFGVKRLFLARRLGTLVASISPGPSRCQASCQIRLLTGPCCGVGAAGSRPAPSSVRRWFAADATSGGPGGSDGSGNRDAGGAAGGTGAGSSNKNGNETGSPSLKTLDEILQQDPPFLEWFVQVYVPSQAMLDGNTLDGASEQEVKQFVSIAYASWVDLGKPLVKPA